MSLAIVGIAIVSLVALVVWAKVHPFLAFVIVSAAAALALGMPASAARCSESSWSRAVPHRRSPR
jgi:H+/gluconate symporter-like permease